MLNSWKMTLQNEFGLCIERFEYLKHVKAEWTDVLSMLDRQKLIFAKLEQNLLPKHCFAIQKKAVCEEINNMKELFKEFFELQVERYYKLEMRLNQEGCRAENSFKIQPYNVNRNTFARNTKEGKIETTTSISKKLDTESLNILF